MNEPVSKRVVAYFDGQNLFNAAKEAFGYQFPNYDVRLLSESVCALNSGWGLSAIHFYTGIPDRAMDPVRHHFWVAKLAAMGTNRLFQFKVSSATNVNFAIQASTNLITWTSIASGYTDTNGLLIFQDSNTASFTKRFYRAAWTSP